MTVSAMFALGAAQVASAANSVAGGIKTNQPNRPAGNANGHR